MIPDGPTKKRLNPFKVLCLILYGTFEFVEWEDKEKVTLKIGPFARHIQVQNYRLKKYLEWLQEYGLIEDFSHTYGTAEFRVMIPKRWRQDNVEKTYY